MYSNEKIVKYSLFMGLVCHINISNHGHLMAIMTMALGNGEARRRLQTDWGPTSTRGRESISLVANFEQCSGNKEKLEARDYSESSSCFGRWSQGMFDFQKNGSRQHPSPVLAESHGESRQSEKLQTVTGPEKSAARIWKMQP